MPLATQLRKEVLAARNRLSEKKIKARSLAIQRAVLSLEEVQNHQSIFIYVSFKSEVISLDLLDILLKLGKHVSVPITKLREKRLDAVQITNRAIDLEPGYDSILEPRKTLCRTQTIKASEVETIILPGSVFDERGGRYGYGGGYYDRFLAKVPAAARIGLGYDLQVKEKIPLKKHDEILDLLVTETRIIRGRS